MEQEEQLWGLGLYALCDILDQQGQMGSAEMLLNCWSVPSAGSEVLCASSKRQGGDKPEIYHPWRLLNVLYLKIFLEKNTIYR